MPSSFGLSRSPQSAPLGPPEHAVQFYSDDHLLIDGIETLLCDAVENGDAAICVATKKHLAALAVRLRMRSPAISGATEQGRYLVLDVADVMSTVVSEGKLDEAVASEFFGRMLANVTAAIAKEARVAVFGETVASLWARGEVEAVMALEQLWNNLARLYPISVRCGYSTRTFDHPRDTDYFRMICREHSSVIAPEGYPPVIGEQKNAQAATESEQLSAQERKLVESDAELDYPHWQRQYRAAVLETDRTRLFKKVEIAQAAVLTRLTELRGETDHEAERHQLMQAWNVIQIIKRKRLNFFE